MNFGTVLVATWSPDEIILGADGKELSSEQHGTVSNATSKIWQVREDMFFMLSGLVGSDETGFEAAPLVERACREGAGPEKILETMDSLIEAPLGGAVLYTMQKKRNDFGNYLQRRAALGVVIAGKTENRLFVARRAFMTKRRGQAVKFERQGCFFPDRPNRPFDFWGSGSQETETAFWKRLTPAKIHAHSDD